jgi:hypothetical protein
MKKLRRILTLGLALFMTLGLALPVSAANYTPIPGTDTELYKYLVVNEDAEIPEAEFEFTVSAGQAKEATATTVKVWPGVRPDLVKVNGVAHAGTVKFVAGEDATSANAVTALGQANAAGKKAAKKTIALDFSDPEIKFSEPGVYSYLLTETDPVAPIAAVDSKVTTIHVYVEDNNGVLEVKDYVAYEGNVSNAAPLNDVSVDMNGWLAENPEPVRSDYPETTAGEEEFNNALTTWQQNRHDEFERRYAAQLIAVPNGAEAGVKDDKFVNELASANIKFGKETFGNQASRDQWFKFTLELTNLGKGTVLTLDMSEAENGVAHENTATSYSKATMEEANKRDDDKGENSKPGQQIIANDSGNATVEVYLHDGMYVTLKGLPEGATYILEEENAAGYTKHEKITQELNGTRAYDDEVSGIIGKKMETKAEHWTYAGKEYATLEEANRAALGPDAEPLAPGEMAEGVEHHEAGEVKAADQDVYTGYSNERRGVIPTGLLVSVGTPLAIGAAAVGLFLAKRKKEDEE